MYALFAGTTIIKLSQVVLNYALHWRSRQDRARV